MVLLALHLVMKEIHNFGIWVEYHLLNILKCMDTNQFIMIQEKKFQVSLLLFLSVFVFVYGDHEIFYYTLSNLTYIMHFLVYGVLFFCFFFYTKHDVS